MTSGRHFQVLAFFLLSLLFASSCTRPHSKETIAKFDLRPLGKVQAQSMHELKFLVIQAHGQGVLNDTRLEWNKDEQGGVLPSSFELRIPRGTKRLIQVFAVYQDSSKHNSMLFTYGDALKDLEANEERVTIHLNKINESNSPKLGIVKGRYLTTATSGPTGLFHAFYAPSNRPRIRLFPGEMYSGWFETMAFKDLHLEYRLHNGDLLFGGARQLSYFEVQGMSLVLPNRYEDKDGTPEAEPRTSIVLGHFGPGKGTQLTCLDPDAVFEFDSLFEELGMITKLSYQPSNTGSVKVYGNDSSCSGDKFEDFLKLDLTKLNDDDFAHSMGFKTPFITMPGGGLLELGDNMGVPYLFWEVLPGVKNDISGFELWLKEGMVSEDELREWTCHHAPFVGFRKLADLGATDSHFPMPSVNSRKGALLLCPKVGVHPGFSTARLRYDDIAASHISLHPQEDPVLGVGACRSLVVELSDYSGSAINAVQPIVVDLSASPVYAGGTLTFFSTPNCAHGSQINEVTIESGSASGVVYTSADALDYYSISADSRNFSPHLKAYREIAVTHASANAAVASTQLHATELLQEVGGCYPAEVRLMQSSTEPAYAGTNWTFSIDANVDFTFHADADCATADISGVTVFSGDARAVFYMKPTSTTSATSVSVSYGAATSFTPNIQIVNP